MARRKIIWTKKAIVEKKEILEYWINRNKSKSFSTKLNQLILEDLRTLSVNPEIGKKTDFENIRVIMIRDYLLFFEIHKNELVVLAIWDSRRNPNKMKIK
ncbi:MAG: type II toxin-antitoxin system RelE/ParE family toxin [Bacteroidetes bacterium HGW-Bacteroidetes-2]|jgi:toxin YoeB|nr:MAG: type II toxin-antitoxin system RelE/ParE family toxin [Bacteroidetes bacterium HGW-Bacteroidetes-2]